MSAYFKIGSSGNALKEAIDSMLSAYPITNTGSAQPLIGDFNHDGHSDVAIMYYEFAPGQVVDRPTYGRAVILAGDGTGKFKDGSSAILGDVASPYLIRKLAVADLNGDGQDDIALVANYEDGRATDNPMVASAPQVVLLSSGNGTLNRVDLGMDTWGHAIAVGDLNGDQRTDLVLGGFTLPEGQTDSTTAAFFQLPDGTLGTPSYLGDLSSGAVTIGDFDGDGTKELADFFLDFSQPSWPSGLRMVDVNPDGSRGSTIVNLSPPLRLQEGIAWNGSPGLFAIRVGANGEEYVDQGLQEVKAADLNGDGRDEVIGIRYGFEMNSVNGHLTEGGGDPLNALEFYTLGQSGLAPMEGAWIKGWKPALYGVQDIHIVDYNGDGHLDLFVPWPFDTEDDKGVGVRLFLNDGAAHFTRVKQSLLPNANDFEPSPMFGLIASPIDANEDGIMDIMLTATGFDLAWTQWNAKSETVFLGTKKFYTGAGYTDPALRGAAGFNEQYYLNTYADAAKAVKKGKFDDGLDHYLSVGKAKGYLGFAVDTHIFGSDKNDTIKAREGEERLDGGLGKDTLTGGGSSDTFVFSTKLGSTNVDTIKDFKPVQGDLIALDGDVFKKIGAALDEGEFHSGEEVIKAHDRSDRIIYDIKSGKLFFDVDGTKKNGADAVHFATLSNKPALDHGDFVIV